MEKSNPNKALIANTIHLYVLTISTQLLNVIYIPYITRMLGPQKYGLISFALSIMSYIQLILDMGFTLSATNSVANRETDRGFISELFTAITVYKTIIGMLLLSILYILSVCLKVLFDIRGLLVVYGVAFLINSFLPDYIYRGKQRMKNITYRTIVIKIIFTALVFLLVKKPDDYIRIPWILMVGNSLAVLVSWIDLRISFNISFRVFSIEMFRHELKKALPFLASRIASTFYQAMNVIVIGVLYPGKAEVGYYGSADRINTLVKTAASPVADSLYPYMLKRRNYNLVKRIIIMYSIVALCAIYPIYQYSASISTFLFGIEYYEVGNVIRLLLPAMVVILPSYLICFPVLVPMGHTKEANLSNIIGAIVQVVLLGIIVLVNKLNLYTVCVISSISEVVVFVYRLMVWIKYSKEST